MFCRRSRVPGQLPELRPRPAPLPLRARRGAHRPGRHRPRSPPALTVLPAAAGPCSIRESAASSILRMERAGSAEPGAESRPPLSFSRRRLRRLRRDRSPSCVPAPCACAGLRRRGRPGNAPWRGQSRNVTEGHSVWEGGAGFLREPRGAGRANRVLRTLCGLSVRENFGHSEEFLL